MKKAISKPISGSTLWPDFMASGLSSNLSPFTQIAECWSALAWSSDSCNFDVGNKEMSALKFVRFQNKNNHEQPAITKNNVQQGPRSQTIGSSAMLTWTMAMWIKKRFDFSMLDVIDVERIPPFWEWDFKHIHTIVPRIIWEKCTLVFPMSPIQSNIHPTHHLFEVSLAIHRECWRQG